MKHLLNLFKIILFPLSILFASIIIYNNFEIISNRLISNYKIFIFLIITHASFHFFLNLRSFFILKKKVTKQIYFISWSQNFFKSILVQDTLISHTAFLFRAIYLKTLNIKNHQLFSFFLFAFFSYFSINFIFVILELNFLLKPNIKNIILQIFILFFLITIAYKISKVIEYIKKKIKFNNFIFEKIIKILTNLEKDQIPYFDDKLFLIKIFAFGALLHVHEILILYCSFIFFEIDISLHYIVLLFGISTISDRIPIVSSIPMIREILFGIISINFGLSFQNGFLIKSLTKMSAISSSFINIIWSTFIKIILNNTKQYRKKNLY